MIQSTHMIDIKALRVIRNDTTICSVSNLRITNGERVAILGANGSGKTTLLRILTGMETNYEGNCVVNASSKGRVYVQQAPYLFRGTVLSNVTYGLRSSGIPRVDHGPLAAQWLERLGLSHLIKNPVKQLSGGERRRVALARAMILCPKLLLLDEPFADMDEAGVVAVCNAIRELPQTTILIASPTTVPEELISRVHRL